MRGSAHPDRLRLRVLHEIRRRRLWTAGQRVAVAVSGGVDSVVLLDVLARTARAHGGRLEVVTVDHRARPDSGADADFVWALAQARGLPVTRFDLAPGPGTEAAWRAARYAALDRVGVDAIALGHHGDDLAETVLIQLVRGAGPAAIGPMSWRRGRYVRPLLSATRAEIAAYATSRGLQWREDPSNGDPRHLRVRVRREVLPLLEAIRSGAGRAIARFAREGMDTG